MAPPKAGSSSAESQRAAGVRRGGGVGLHRGGADLLEPGRGVTVDLHRVDVEGGTGHVPRSVGRVGPDDDPERTRVLGALALAGVGAPVVAEVLVDVDPVAVDGVGVLEGRAAVGGAAARVVVDADHDVGGEGLRGERRSARGGHDVARTGDGRGRRDVEGEQWRAVERALTLEPRLGLGLGVLPVVEQVDRLAPDVGVGLVHRAGLPLVDQPGGVLGVGVAPLVRDGVVGGDAGAVVGADAVPVGVGAVDGRVVVDRLHRGPGAVVAVATEGVHEHPVRLAGALHLAGLVLVEATGERVTLLPHQVGGVEGLLVELAVGRVGDHRPPVDRLAGQRVEDDRLAHRALVGHLHDPGEQRVAVDATGGAHPVDHQVGACGADAGGGAVLGAAGELRRVAHEVDGARGRVGLRQRRRDREVEVRDGEAVDGRQVALLVDVGHQLAGEDRHPPEGLGELDGPAADGLADPGLRELGAPGAERGGVLVEVREALAAAPLAPRASTLRQQVALGADEADPAGRVLLRHRDRAVGLGTDLLLLRAVRCRRRRGGGGRCCGQRGKTGPQQRKAEPLLEDLQRDSLRVVKRTAQPVIRATSAH